MTSSEWFLDPLFPGACWRVVVDGREAGVIRRRFDTRWEAHRFEAIAGGREIGQHPSKSAAEDALLRCHGEGKAAL